MLLLGMALVAVSCRTGPRTAPLADLVPPGTASFALDPIPAPREAELSSRLLELGPAAMEGGRAGEGAVETLREIFVDPAEGSEIRVIVQLADLPGGAPEEFRLVTRLDGGTVRIEIAGDEAGRLWAAETLRQLVWEADGRRWVREVSIVDRPGFPLRGSKRPRAWERQYRENLAYESPGPREMPWLTAVAVLSPGGRLDATSVGLARAEEFFRKGLAGGVRRFAIEFDDVGFGMTEETENLYGGYVFAISGYLRNCRKRLRDLDPDAVLYWLPQTYWTDHPRLANFALAVSTSGGLPEDLGLVLTGPEIISASIPASEIARARARFGLTAQKALIYDNLGREGDHGPLRGRGADLVGQVDAVFGERGEPLNRITRLAYAWNPVGYDPVRAHLLACREIVGPAAAPVLSRLVLENASLPPGAREALQGEVRAKLLPPAHSPVDARVYVERLFAELEVELP